MASTLDQATIPIYLDDDPDQFDEVDVERDPESIPSNELPNVDVTDTELAELVNWLTSEINSANSERQYIEDEWAEIQRLYEQTELSEKKDFPFEGAAMLVIPLIAIYTETIWAKLVSTIFAPSDPFTAKPTRSEFIDAYRAVTKFCTWSAKEELDLKTTGSAMIMELTKLGTCAAKVVYSRQNETRFVYDPANREYTKVVEMVKDQPEVIHIPLADLLFRLSKKRFSELPWKAHRIKYSLNDLEIKAADGTFDKDVVEDVKSFIGKKESNTERANNEAVNVNSLNNDELDVYEIWFSYALKGNKGTGKEAVKLVGFFHKDSGKFLRLQYNWYPLQLDPFEICPYIIREHLPYGIGVGRMAGVFQKEISTMHNQRLDNATVANANVLLSKDDISLPLNMTLRPGAHIPVDDPNAVKMLQLGQKYDSTIGDEQHSMSIVQQRIGIHEFMQQANTSTQAIINVQEGAKKSDMIVDNTRTFFANIMEKAMLLYQQYYPDGKPVVILGDTDGTYIEEIFRLPPKSIKQGIGIQVTATTSASSKELQRQSKLALFNVLGAYYDKINQYYMQINNPQMPEPIREVMFKTIDGLSRLVKSIVLNITSRIGSGICGLLICM